MRVYKYRRLLAWIGCVFCFFFVVSFLLHYFDGVLARPFSKTWVQPEDIEYGLEWDLILKVSGELTPIEFYESDRKVRIYIGGGSYGFTKQYCLDFESNDKCEEYLNQCTVNWGDEEVTFIEPSGYQLVIPKEIFMKWR